MRKLGIIAVLSLMALALAAVPALADSPHFNRASATLDNTTGNLVVSFKESGLGTNQNIAYLATADATAEYQCWNNGGKHPKAGNKETVSGPVSAEGTFSSGKNGTISQSLTLMPPDQGAFSCPAGQTLYLQSVTYTNVSLTDTTNVIAADLSSGPYSSGTLHIAVL
jgi:hypothetical protein